MDAVASMAQPHIGTKRKRDTDSPSRIARERMPPPPSSSSSAAAFHAQYTQAQQMTTFSGPTLSDSNLAFDPTFSISQYSTHSPASFAAPTASRGAPQLHDPAFTSGLDNCQQPGGICHNLADPFHCGMEDVSKDCGALPCNNPHCEDVSPCQSVLDECADPLKCLGNICYDQQCVPQDDGGAYWCHEDCDEATRCASPCFSDECGVPACSEPCIDSKPAVAGAHGTHHIPPGHQVRQRDVLCQSQDCEIPAFECVDPRCLSNSFGSGTHFHHELSSFYDEFEHDQLHHHTHAPHHMGDPFAVSADPFIPHNLNAQAPTTKGKGKGPLDSLEYVIDFDKPPYRPTSRSDAGWNLASTPLPELSNSLTATPRSTDVSDLRSTISSPGQPHQHVCMWSADIDGQPTGPCGQMFKDAADLHNHVEKAHVDSLQREASTSSSGGYWCRWAGCGRSHQGTAGTAFAARPKLKRHVQTHTLYKPFVCSTCGTSMKTKDAMEKHLRTHTGERPYRCPLAACAKIFATSTELKTHMVVHSGRKPHECPLCGESFADSSNLSKHKKTHFLGMYRCAEPGCGVRMKRWDQMRRHIASQGHCRHLLDDMEAQKAYKACMEREWRELPDEQKLLRETPAMSRKASVARS